jgi:soluble lytic murein transglycosylase-like protein
VSTRPGNLQRILGVVFVGVGLAVLLMSWRLGAGERRVASWQEQITLAAEEHGIEPAMLAALVYAESRGDEHAVSSIGALGLCQLLPTTAEEEAQRQGIEGPPYTAQDNLRLGAGYLARMFQYWDGDEDLALLSYRLGPTGVRRRMEAAGGREAWLQELQQNLPSPWGYRAQIARMQETFAKRFQP